MSVTCFSQNSQKTQYKSISFKYDFSSFIIATGFKGAELASWLLAPLLWRVPLLKSVMQLCVPTKDRNGRNQAKVTTGKVDHFTLVVGPLCHSAVQIWAPHSTNTSSDFGKTPQWWGFLTGRSFRTYVFSHKGRTSFHYVRNMHCRAAGI